jgi:Asparagine synthase
METDWLGSQSVFYHERTGKVSHHIHEVIDFNSFDWDDAGLKNYLDCGFSVFGHTPLRYVKFLPAATRIETAPDQPPSLRLTTVIGDEELAHQINQPMSVDEVLALIQHEVQQWESSHAGPIVLPLSGGFDSRLLVDLLADKTRIRAFTYGVTKNQAECTEVSRAQRVAQRLGVNWQQVYLSDFFLLIPQWYQLFGISTHTHGMYHMEMYQQIVAQGYAGASMLSGLIGDAWAGSLSVPPLLAPQEVLKLSYNHNWSADSRYLKRQPNANPILEAYFDQKRELLQDPRFRVLEAMRTKIMLLKYLIDVPTWAGLLPFAPFIVREVALGILALPDQLRAKRKWQRDYFDQRGLLVEKNDVPVPTFNYQEQYAMLKNPLPLLSEKILGEIVDEKYVQWVNRNLLNNFKSRFDFWLYQRFRTTRGLWRLTYNHSEVASAAYQTLYPLQKVMEERDRTLKT